jgi:HAD superfamily hydrolase (TIGR01509 family)
MGSALGANWIAGGATVRTCLADRSARSRQLAEAAGLELVDTLDDVVRSEIVVSVVPPGQALAAAHEIARAARRTGATPLVVDLNAVAPSTLAELAGILGEAGLDLVDGSISGPPPTASRHPRVYLCGPRAPELERLASPWLEVIRIDQPLGSASALKMCTASMYKGSTALVMQAMLTARKHGVLELFLADTTRHWPADVPNWPADVALAATKADRFVDEMREIATTQADAGVAPELFDGIAAAYERAAQTPLAQQDPESIDPGSTQIDDILAGLTSESTIPGAVLFDFSGTLFYIESAQQAVLAALGPQHLAHADELVRFGAINGSGTPDELPPHLADVWAERDLSAAAHRAAYSGLARHAGLTEAQAGRLYDRGISAEAWHPFPDTISLLRELHRRHVPVALISNIGWDPMPVLERYGVDRDLDVYVLSYERGVEKPNPEIFRVACAELGVDPNDAVMIGDNPQADGGAQALGIRFVLVPADPARREAGEMYRAAGLPG